MRKCCELAQPKSCLNSAHMEEPIFVLRAQDAMAPIVVEMWAHKARGCGASKEKVQGALDTAQAMRDWARTHGSKVPD